MEVCGSRHASLGQHESHEELIRFEEYKLITAASQQPTAIAGPHDCVIDARWLREWRDYTLHDGPRPGPVANERLLLPSGDIRRVSLFILYLHVLCIFMFFRWQI